MLEDLEAKDLFPKIPKAWIIGPLVLIAGVAGVSIYSCYGRHQVAAHVQQADQDRTSATSDAAQGAAYDQEATAAEPKLQDDATEVARLRAELARVRKAPPAAPAPPPVPGTPEPEPVAPPVDLAAVVAQQDLLIQAQDKQISDQAVQIHTLTLARDSWKAAAGDSAAEAVQLRSALAAKDGLIRAAEIKGFLYGFAAGGASGATAVSIWGGRR